MFDLRWIRDNPEAFDRGLARRGLEPMAAAVIELDARRRSVQTALQDMQARRNEASKEIGVAKREGRDAQDLIAEVAVLKERLQQAEEALVALGYQILAVSPDDAEHLAESADEHKLRYQLLSDADMEAAKAFGVAYRLTGEILDNYGETVEEASGRTHHLLPVPAVFVVGTEGMIRFQYVNPDYRVRLHPEVLLAVARTMGGE